MIWVITTLVVILMYLAFYAAPVSDMERCLINYTVLAYFVVILWKCMIKEEN